MTDSIRDRLRDELAGWPIGSGYYLTTVSVDEARDMADAVLAVLRDLPDDVIERAARELFLEDANVAYEEWPEWDSPENIGKPIYIENARAAFRAAFGGEQDDE